MFQIAFEQVESGKEGLRRFTRRQAEFREMLHSVIHTLEGMESYEELAFYLRGRQQDLEEEQCQAGELLVALERIGQIYLDAENRIVDNTENPVLSAAGSRLADTGLAVTELEDPGEWGDLIRFWEA